MRKTILKSLILWFYKAEVLFLVRFVRISGLELVEDIKMACVNSVIIIAAVNIVKLFIKAFILLRKLIALQDTIVHCMHYVRSIQ